MAPLTVAVTLCSTARLSHLQPQLDRVARLEPPVPRVVVWLDDAPAPDLPALRDATVVHVPPGPGGLRLAEGRNRGAAAARSLGARLLVFLDADCLPGDDLVRRYEEAAEQHPGAVLCGPVTYLPEGWEATGATLAASTRPHAARPAPEPGTTVVAAPGDHRLFWSLSFAVTPETWDHVGGFSPLYEGYGGEDTDFAFAAERADVPLVWVGGADAYHQWHPTSSPPWQHLDDVLANGAVFAVRWGTWPMEGWLEAFERAGAVERHDGGWRRVAADGAAVGRVAGAAAAGAAAAAAGTAGAAGA